jgi:hypothetical protein
MVYFIAGGLMVAYGTLDLLTILMLRRLHDSLMVRVAAGIIAISLGFLILDWLWSILSAGNGEGRYVLLAVELILMRVVYITTWWIAAWVRRGLAVSYGRATVREDRR